MADGGFHTTSSKNSFKDATNGMLGKRPKGQNQQQLVFSLQQKSAPAPEKKKADKRFLFVEDDGEGPELKEKPKTSTVKKSRKVKQPAFDKKNADLFVVNSKGGTEYPSGDGKIVRINLSKLMMMRLTEEKLEEYSRLKDASGKALTTDHFECLIPTADQSHARFISVGSNTSNISIHCKKQHPTVIEAMARLIEQIPAEEAMTACRDYVQSLKVPDTTLNRFLQIDEATRVSSEASALIWFLDASIPFAQFDNSLFKHFCERLGGRYLSSTKTILETLLPALYQFVSSDMVATMSSWVGFFTTFDGWSKFNHSYVSQHYHGISSKSFEFSILMLDLIPSSVGKYRETIGAALVTRQQYWTESFDHLIAAGGLGDNASNIQSAGGFVFGKSEMSRCQCHMLALCLSDIENLNLDFNSDTSVMSKFCAYVAVNGNVVSMLQNFQEVNGLSELHVLLECETRWNGLFFALERFCLLEESLKSLKALPVVTDLKDIVPDFLEGSFFLRLRGYQPYLAELHSVSVLYQTQKFPVGCFVPLMSIHLNCFFQHSNMDAPFVASFKRSLLKAMQTRLSPTYSSVNNFLKVWLI